MVFYPAGFGERSGPPRVEHRNRVVVDRRDRDADRHGVGRGAHQCERQNECETSHPGIPKSALNCCTICVYCALSGGRTTKNGRLGSQRRGFEGTSVREDCSPSVSMNVCPSLETSQSMKTRAALGC